MPKKSQDFIAPIPVHKKEISQLSSDPEIEPQKTLESVEFTDPPKKPMVQAIKQPIMPTKTPKKPIILPNERYTVQLALFSSKNNAQSLINRLKTKGYVGKISTIQNNKEAQYKVFVGNVGDKTRALQLRNQLAVAFQIDGFVVARVA
jgi:cell division septation protein DedD